MKFSDRMGFTSVKIVQKDNMDTDLKNGLWNVIYIYIFFPMLNEKYSDGSGPKTFIKNSKFRGYINSIWLRYYKEPVDEIPLELKDIVRKIKKRFYESTFYEVYNLIEYLLALNTDLYDRDKLKSGINDILQKEMAAYRIVDDEICPIIGDSEINEIENAVNQTEKLKYQSSNDHLKAALRKLSDKIEPDYRNSVKESISGVESILKIISNEPNATLGEALNSLKNILSLHPAQVEGFKKLYGFLSDTNARHGQLESFDFQQEDAIYFLVSCSAFINYLIIKSEKTE